MPMATCKLLVKQRFITLFNNRWSCKQVDEEKNIEQLLCFCPAQNFKSFQTLESYSLPNLADIQGVSMRNPITHELGK